ncbi:MAG: glycosyltransferase family 39 protein [bacterium]|nr:glycosyltransferase family 39 protein [bacterium]
MKRIEFFLLTLILLGAFAARLYRFDGPVADWHSWRQSDTSAVSRNFIKFGFDILHPRFDDLSNGVSLIDNPMGYRFVEFPIYNLFQAGLFTIFGYFTIEQWGRLVAIFSSGVAIIFLYLIVKKYISTRAGLFAAFFYAFVPYSIYYGRVILPDQLMVALMLGGIYFFDEWIEKGGFRFFPAAILIASSVLIKPFVLFFALPLIYLVWRKFGFGMLKKKELWIFLILSILPLILWRLWMQQYPEGIPRNDWLFNGNGIRFKGAFFHWIFAERISHLILGFFGLPLVIIGLLVKVKKEGWFFSLFVVSSLIYVTDIATGNIQHDYYQILIIPTLAILFAKGIDFSFSKAGDLFHRYTTYLVIFVSILFMLAFGWFRIRDFYSIQHPEIVEAGIAIDRLTPKDAKVIAIYNGDTAFLYQTKRQGWPVFERSMKDFVKAGATYIAFVNPRKEELNFANEFATVEIAKQYAIFDLTKPTSLGIKHFFEEKKK